MPDSSTRHIRAKDVFLEAIALPKSEWQRVLDRECAGDAELRSEVESLLRHHSDQTLHHAPTSSRFRETAGNVSHAFVTYFAGSRLRQAVLAGALLAAGAAALAWEINRIRREALLQTAEHLLIEADLSRAGMGRWIDEWTFRVQAAARDPLILSAALQLEAESQKKPDSVDTLLRSPARGAIQEGLRRSRENGAFRTFALVGRNGNILSSDIEEAYGKQLSGHGASVHAETMAGGTVFTPPSRQQFLRDAAAAVYQAPLVWVSVPLRDKDTRIFAALYFARLASDEFASLLGKGTRRLPGEVYAIGGDGGLLSTGRYVADLRRLQGAGDSPATSFEIAVRDPGDDMRTAGVPSDLDSRPMTAPAAQVLASKGKPGERQRGMLAEPYRNYLGVSVVGAWNWDDRHQFGIISEQEASAVERPVGTHVWILGTLALGGGLAAAWLMGIGLGLRRRTGPALSMGERRLGSYTLLQKIGEGGMGEVYLARHDLLKRVTAVKMIRPDRVSRESVDRFEREVQLACKLRHPNTIQIFDFGHSADGAFFYAMEYLNGITLKDLVENHGPTNPARAVQILQQVCASLREAHQAGLLHRDIKPQNIMLCSGSPDYDFVKVLDFGLVKEMSTDGTSAGSLLAGTPQYMSPERFEPGAAVDERSDVYSIGGVAYWLIAGAEFQRAPAGLGHQHPFVPPSLRTAFPVPEAMDQLIEDCLNPNPETRPRSMKVLLERLAAIPVPGPWTHEDAAEWWNNHAPDTLTAQLAAGERKFPAEPRSGHGPFRFDSSRR